MSELPDATRTPFSEVPSRALDVGGRQICRSAYELARVDHRVMGAILGSLASIRETLGEALVDVTEVTLKGQCLSPVQRRGRP